MEEFLMNRSSPGTSKSKVSLSLAKAIEGFLKFKTAEGLSQRTITSYEFTLGHWLKYIGDREVSEIQSSDLTGYMAWLRTEYKPRRWTGSSEPLSAKSIRNVWVTFRSFFGWLQVEFKFPNPAKEIATPKFQKHPIETFTKEDVEKLLKACVYSRESQTEERKKFVMRQLRSNPNLSHIQVVFLVIGFPDVICLHPTLNAIPRGSCFHSGKRIQWQTTGNADRLRNIPRSLN